MSSIFDLTKQVLAFAADNPASTKGEAADDLQLAFPDLLPRSRAVGFVDELLLVLWDTGYFDSNPVPWGQVRSRMSDIGEDIAVIVAHNTHRTLAGRKEAKIALLVIQRVPLVVLRDELVIRRNEILNRRDTIFPGGKPDKATEPVDFEFWQALQSIRAETVGELNAVKSQIDQIDAVIADLEA